MFKVVLFKELNVRSGQTPLRFKVYYSLFLDRSRSLFS